MKDPCIIRTCEDHEWREGYCYSHYHAWQSYLRNLDDKTPEATRLIASPARPAPTPAPTVAPVREPTPRTVVQRAPKHARPRQSAQQALAAFQSTPSAHWQLWRVRGELRIGSEPGKRLTEVNTTVVARDQAEALDKARESATPLPAWWNLNNLDAQCADL